ncbi:MAG TPA: hypothetical protein VGN31_15560 [Paraburkholderia sp.]|jgi:hypothetical protein
MKKLEGKRLFIDTANRSASARKNVRDLRLARAAEQMQHSELSAVVVPPSYRCRAAAGKFCRQVFVWQKLRITKRLISVFSPAKFNVMSAICRLFAAYFPGECGLIAD